MQHNFNLDEVRQQILDFMLSLEIQPYDESDLILDGELRRYRIHDDKSSEKSGAYCIHSDGWPAGFVQDWRKGIKENWRYDISGLDDEQRKYFNSEEYRKKCEEQERRAEAARKAKHLERSGFARKLWEKLQPAPEDHPYLQRKHVNSYGLRFNPSWYDGPIDSLKDCLAVPLKDKDGQLMSIQWIPADSGQHKLFYQGAELKGAFFSIELEKLKTNSAQVVLLGEGYATMAKVHELTGYPVAAAMSCHRLQEIAGIIHNDFPNAKIIITADNDHKTEKNRGRNPGLFYAQGVVKRNLAVGYIAPEFQTGESGTDWDDYALLHGDKETARVLRDKISEALNAGRKAHYQALSEELGLLRSESFKEFIVPPKGEIWLIDSWIPSKGMMMMFAPSGSGKGFVAIDMAFAIACPHINEWKGYKIPKHGHVIYFAGEGQRGMRKRCAGLCNKLKIDPSHVKMDIISDALPIDDPNPRSGIERVLANIGRLSVEPAVAIFDTTNRYMSGDENKTVEAGAYVRACQRLEEEFGCVVLTIHHTGQSQDTQNRARGSSVFKASVDMELKVSKDGNVITVEVTKSKDSEPPAPMKLVMQTVEVPGYFKSNGEPDTTCVLLTPDEAIDANLYVPESATTEEKVEKLTEAEDLAKRSYSDAAMQYGRLIHATKFDKEVVCVSKEDWRQVFYSLSSADNTETKNRQFTRARKAMCGKLELAYMQKLDGQEYYCLTPTGKAYELGIVLHLRRQKEDAQ